jgi:ribose-phosphate pyrophosphokinase
MRPQLLLAFDGETTGAEALAAQLDLPLACIARHRFPDGEVKLRLPPQLPERVLLLRGLHQPNEKLAELMIAAPAARELGARQLVLLAPYLAYMRQDIAFQPGEAVSQRHVAGLLARLFDAVVTVDPHLHRIRSLDEVMPGSRGVALSAAALLGRFAAQQVPGAYLVGPDEESRQWVGVAAQALGLDHAVCVKQRHGDHEVQVTLPEALDAPLQGRAVVLIDDVASTARTMMEAARVCFARGAATVDAAVTHALFVGDALAQLRAAGVRHVWSTDAVPHETNAVPLAPLLAQAVATLA